MRWTRKSIIAEIRRLKNDGAELNYATAESEYLNLVRAAAWHFGTWRRAVEAAGIDYESLCKYKRWSRDRIVARIRELKHEGADLSWRAVSTQVDPPLAAAALRPNGFKSWPEAVQAAGLDINEVARYQNWTAERVLRDIKALQRAKHPLSSKAVQYSNQKLFCAARRRFGSWDGALEAAGFSADKIRLRLPARGNSDGVPSDVSSDHGVVANGRVKSPKAVAKAVKSARANNQPELPLAAAPKKPAGGKIVAKTSPLSKEPKATAKTATTKTTAKAPTAKAAPKTAKSAASKPAKAAATKAAPASKAPAAKAPKALAKTAAPKSATKTTATAKAPAKSKAPAKKNTRSAK